MLGQWVTNNRGWQVGKVRRGVYTKRMKRINWFKDYMGDGSGWILDCDELKDAQRLGASKIRLIDTTSDDTVYETTVEVYRTMGIYHEGKNGDFVVLRLQDFKSDYKNFPVKI